MATARQAAPFMTPDKVRRASDELRRQEDELQAATAVVLAEIAEAQDGCVPAHAATSQTARPVPAEHSSRAMGSVELRQDPPD